MRGCFFSVCNYSFRFKGNIDCVFGVYVLVCVDVQLCVLLILLCVFVSLLFICILILLYLFLSFFLCLLCASFRLACVSSLLSIVLS